LVGKCRIGFGIMEEDEGVGCRRLSISSIDLIKVANNSIIVLMGK